MQRAFEKRKNKHKGLMIETQGRKVSYKRAQHNIVLLQVILHPNIILLGFSHCNAGIPNFKMFEHAIYLVRGFRIKVYKTYKGIKKI